MKRTTIISLVLAVFCPCMASVADEVSYLPYIDINGASVSKAGANVELSMTVDVSELRIGTQHTVALIPVIVSKDGASEAEFPPIVIDGRTRSKVYYRAQVLESVELPPYHDGGAETIMLRDNGEQQSYDYAAAIPYARWMLDGRLEIREEVHGCVNCQEGRDSLDMFPVLPEYIPDYRLAAIEPEPEPVKTRMETRTARLNFRQDSHTIRPDYKDNRAQLDTVKNSIEAVRDDRDLEITGIFITGYASPEASEAYNKALSQRRADALREWIAADEDIDLSLVHSVGKGEDWNGFVSSLDGVRMLAGLDRIKRIISENEGKNDWAELQIQKLDDEIYRRLLNEVYPPLRRLEYRIEYNVKNFTLEEARQMLDERPDLLSLQEIYMVAESYGKGTSGYEKAMAAAAEYYPDSPAVLGDRALAAIGRGDYAEAARLLSASDVTYGNAELLNMLGVARAQSGRYDEAADCLGKAAGMGSESAVHNLSELNKVTDQL